MPDKTHRRELFPVALRKESVDRNAHDAQAMKGGIMSLSARRAWIEICTAETDITLIGRSLSARRAWIEIGRALRQLQSALRSLSARRAWIEIIDYVVDYATAASLSARRAWIEISRIR